MAKVVTITDLAFTEASLYSTVDNGGVTHIFVAVGFSYTNASGLAIRGERTIELTGARKTQVATFFANLKSDLIALEGI